PPSRICFSSFRMAETRSAIDRILASNRFEVASIRVVRMELEVSVAMRDCYVKPAVRAGANRNRLFALGVARGIKISRPNLALVDPPLQPYPILFQQKAARAKTFTEYPMRLPVAGDTSDPLASHLVLRGGEPALGKDLDQSSLKVKDEQCHGGIVLTALRIRGGNDQFIHLAQFGRNLKVVRSGFHAYRKLEIT